MCASHVAIMRRVRCESFSTMAAFKRFLTTVLSDVSSQNRRSCESLDAVRAFVRSFPAVDSEMLVQARGLRKPLATLTALVRSVFLMHVQDVNAQTVALLEGAVAKVTGVLPVSLVHAPCVFQMFVAIIFVGEDFAASVASEAISTCCRKIKTKLLLRSGNSKLTTVR